MGKHRRLKGRFSNSAPVRETEKIARGWSFIQKWYCHIGKKMHLTIYGLFFSRPFTRSDWITTWSEYFANTYKYTTSLPKLEKFLKKDKGRRGWHWCCTVDVIWICPILQLGNGGAVNILSRCSSNKCLLWAIHEMHPFFGYGFPLPFITF